MSKLLIDESPLLVLPSLAQHVGLEEAIFLQQLHYWIERSGIEQDGRRWVYNTYEQWAAQFTWWSVQAIRRIVTSLRDQRLIETSTAYNKIAIDKTLWYCIQYDAIDALLNADPSDPPTPANPPQPPPSTTVEINSPSVEIDTSTVEINSPSVENNTPRVENNTPRVEFDTPITIRLMQENTASEGGGGSDPIPEPDHPDSEKNARAPAHATPPAGPPFDDYDTANRHPAALDHALRDIAGLLDPATRRSILEASPDLTVSAIAGWDAYRTRINAKAPATRQMGAGALIALLRTAARPPGGPDPDRSHRWLITHGYLPQPEPTHPPIPADPPSAPTPAAELWTRVKIYYATDPAIRPILDTCTPIDLDHATLTLRTRSTPAYEILKHRLTARLTQTLTTFAGRPLTLTLLPP